MCVVCVFVHYHYFSCTLHVVGDRNDTSASENEVMLPTDQVIHSK